MAKEPAVSKLLPCPFCGGFKLKFDEEELQPGEVPHFCVAECTDCNIHGPYGSNRADAATKWNKRWVRQ